MLMTAAPPAAVGEAAAEGPAAAAAETDSEPNTTSSTSGQCEVHAAWRRWQVELEAVLVNCGLYNYMWLGGGVVTEGSAG